MIVVIPALVVIGLLRYFMKSLMTKCFPNTSLADVMRLLLIFGSLVSILSQTVTYVTAGTTPMRNATSFHVMLVMWHLLQCFHRMSQRI